MLYDRLDLLGPATQSQLIEDPAARTRLPVERCDRRRGSAPRFGLHHRVLPRVEPASATARAPLTRDVTRTTEISRLMMRSPALASDRPRILIVEDDARLATLLSEYLSAGIRRQR